MTEATIKFYAMTAEAAEAELGLVSFDAAARFLVVEFWVEADSYEISGGFKTREALEDAMTGETYSWYC